MSDGNVTAQYRTLTHSAESAYRSCPRRYQLSYVRMYRPAHKSEALRMGDAVHVGLEELKSGRDANAAEAAIVARYDDAGCPPYLTPDEFEVERWTAIAMVRAYSVKWHSSPLLRYVAVEQDFDLPLINPFTGQASTLFRNQGKIDGIAELPDGRMAIVEHKTVGEDIAIDGDYWRRLMLDAQISRYYLAAIALGYPVQTTVYDVIRKPLIRPKNISKADRAYATSIGSYHGQALTTTCPERETPQLYAARLEADMLARPDYYFARNEVARLESDLREYQLDQWSVARSIAATEADGYWPRHTNACTTPYRCQFLDVCRGLSGDANELVPLGFRVAEKRHEELTIA